MEARVLRVLLLLAALAVIGTCTILESSPEIAVHIDAATPIPSDSGALVEILYEITNRTYHEVGFGGCCPLYVTLEHADSSRQRCRAPGPCLAFPCPRPHTPPVAPRQRISRTTRFPIARTGRYRVGVLYASDAGEWCWSWSQHFSVEIRTD